ncbi:MAG: tetratricopeptide repeat protein [Acidobacteriota bacterium]
MTGSSWFRKAGVGESAEGPQESRIEPLRVDTDTAGFQVPLPGPRQPDGNGESATGTEAWITVFVGAVCLAFEILILLWFSRGQVSMSRLGWSHLGAVGVLFGYWRLCERSGKDGRWPLLLGVSTLGTGPLGCAGTLCSMALNRWFQRTSSSFEDWYNSLFPEQQSLLAREVFERIQVAQADPIGQTSAPFADILSYGSLSQKQTVIWLISKHFSPVLAPALLQALKDTDSAVRVQAATAMARIENEFSRRTMELTQAADKDPDNPRLLRRLARHYDDYAFTGLLDNVREMDNRGKALEAYMDVLEKVPDDFSARLAVGRLLLREGRYREASGWFEASTQMGQSSPQMLFWNMESWFQLGCWREIRRLALTHHDELSRMQGFSPQILATLELWALGAKAQPRPAGEKSP